MGQEERSGEEGEALKDRVGPRFGLPKHRWQDAPARQGRGGTGDGVRACPLPWGAPVLGSPAHTLWDPFAQGGLPCITRHPPREKL